MKDNLFKKFLSFSYGSWIGFVIGFLGTIIMTRILLPEDFGKASMFTLTLNAFTIFTIFGTDQAFVRFFYEEREENRGGLLYNCLKLPIVIALIITLLIFIFNRQITIFLFEEENLIVGLILAIGIITQVLYRYGTLVIRMQQKGNLFSVLQILKRVFDLIFFLLLYFLLGKSYEIIIYSNVISLIILTTMSIIFEKNYWNPQNYVKANLKHSKTEIIKYGYPLALTILITWLFQSFDKIAIKQWSNFEELGLYAAAFKIVALLSILQTTFSTFWTPVCYETFQKNPQNKTFFQNMSKLIAFIMFFVAILSIAGKDIIIFLLGKSYRDAANIMPFLVFMPIMYTLSETTVIGINFYKKPKWHILIASVSCLTNIIGNWILVPNYGAIGAAISTAFSYIVFFSLRTQISLKYYKVNYGLKKVYVMILVISIYAIYSIINSNFYLNLLTGFGILTFMLILYYKELTKAYNKFFKNNNSIFRKNKE